MDGIADGSVSRRSVLKHLGVAGFGAVSIAGAAERASMPRIAGSEFDYRFKLFPKGTKIRLGMIGSVGHTATILGDIPSIPDIEITACSDLGDASLSLPKTVRRYETFDDMLKKERLDLVGICLPYYRNAAACIAAAKAGAHVISEKPIATTLDDLASVKRAVTANKVRLTALHSMRAEPRFRVMRSAIDSGAIGEPILATAQKSYKFGASRPDFYKDPATYGGTIPWVGIHAIDFLHFATRLDYTRVAAFQGNKDHPDYPGCEDYVGALFGLGNGGTAVITMDYLRPETAPTHGDDRLRVIGSEGVIEIKDLGERVELIDSSSPARDLEYPGEMSFMADYVAELRGDGKHILTPEEPFEMTRVALLARESAVRGSIIDL